MADQLEKLLAFVRLTHSFQQIKRSILVVGEDRYENDAEHCYQLALTAWYIIEHDRLDLNLSRAIGMAMVHDLVELYAGDTDVFGSNELLDSQLTREQAAVQKLQQAWPELSSLHELIGEYEALGTAESRFVYALDKLLPILNNYLDGGRSWRTKQVTFEQMKLVKAGQVDIATSIGKYYQELLKLLENNPGLFSSGIQSKA